MVQFTKLTSTVAPLLVNDIDTDQIIPARFLKVTDKAGIGKNLFADWRYGDDGTERADFILNRSEYKKCQILLAGHNFGCGSSREHAPWALVDHGFRVVISTSFADIFCNNALKNGLLPVALDHASHDALVALTVAQPFADVSIDLQHQTVTASSGVYRFEIEAFAKTCLLNGVDELGYILRFNGEIDRFERLAHKRGVS